MAFGFKAIRERELAMVVRESGRSADQGKRRGALPCGAARRLPRVTMPWRASTAWTALMAGLCTSDNGVIGSVADEATADVDYGRETKVARRLPKTLWAVIRRKLDALHRARSLQDLRLPADNQLQALKGDRAGTFSMRINDHYRITL